MWLSLLNDIIIIIIIINIIIIDINIDGSSCPSVPGKPIITTPGLCIANRGINFIPQIDSVPESMIKTNLGRNCMLNLTHRARVINSLIGGGKFVKTYKMADLLFHRYAKERSFNSKKLTSTN